MTTIDKRLCLVIPVEREDGSKVYVHSMPISSAFFEDHFLLFSKTFAAIYGEGLGPTAGPRVAMLLLKKIAENMGAESEVAPIVAEMRRLTSVVAPGADTVLLQEAIDKGVLSPRDASEVENAVAFFTVISAVQKRTQAEAVLRFASKLWGGLITSLNSTEYADSLRTSTAPANTGATAEA